MPRAADNWHAAVVDRLIELRAEGPGFGFDTHWRQVISEYPLRGGLQGEATPRLFDERGEAPDTHMAFFRRACEDAYYDRGANQEHTMPRVRFFRPEMLRDLDSSAPARRAVGSRSRFRQAA